MSFIYMVHIRKDTDYLQHTPATNAKQEFLAESILTITPIKAMRDHTIGF